MKKNVWRIIWIAILVLAISLTIYLIKINKVELATTSSFEKPKKFTYCAIMEEEKNNISVIKKASTKGNEFLNEFEQIEYSIKIKNNSENEIKNIEITDEIPDKMILVEEITNENEQIYVLNNQKRDFKWKIESLKSGEEVVFKYKTMLNKIMEEQKIIAKAATVTITELNIEQKSNIIETKVRQGKIELTYKSEDNKIKKQNEELIYKGNINNISGVELKNMEITTNISKNLDYINTKILKYDNQSKQYVENSANAEYDINTGDLKIAISKLDTNEIITFEIYTKVNLKETGVYEDTIENSVQIKLNKENIKHSDKIKNKIGKSAIETKMEQTQVGDKIEYALKIKNIGGIDINNLVISDSLPKEIKPIEISINNAKIYPKQTFQASVNIKKAEELTLKIIGIANSDNSTIIKNTAVIKGLDISETRINAITHIIKNKTLEGENRR